MDTNRISINMTKPFTSDFKQQAPFANTDKPITPKDLPLIRELINEALRYDFGARQYEISFKDLLLVKKSPAGDILCDILPDLIELIVELLPNLTSLNLANTGIYSLPPNIGKLKKLQTLDLNYNKLASLPGTIVNLEALSDLNLSGNREIDLDGNLKLAPYLRLVTALTGLTRLDLGGMRLESLPDSIGNLINLTELDLASNRLKQIPDSIGKLKNLIILKLNSNCLTSLPSTLGELKELRELYLESNRLATLPDSVNGLTNLTCLWLEWNPLNEGLPATLCQCTNLKHFGLTDYQLKALSPEIQAFDKFVYKVK